MDSAMYSFFRTFNQASRSAYEWRGERTVEQQYLHLLQSSTMRNQYLGFCLDSCRIGGLNTCYWPMSIQKLMKLIQHWRKENNDNEQGYHEKPLEKVYKKFELPHIDNDTCPRNKEHERKMEDVHGRVRCFHIERKLVEKPLEAQEFWDEQAQVKRLSWAHIYSDDKTTNEEEFETIIDPCYAIISDKNAVLPFETILRRLNLQPEHKLNYCSQFGTGPCRRLRKLDSFERHLRKEMNFCMGHNDRNNAFEFYGDGWDLAFYLLKWKKQTQKTRPPWRAIWEEHHVPDRSGIVYNDD